MKILYYLLALFFLVSCNKTKQAAEQPIEETSPYPSTPPEVREEHYWKGFINKTIPVFVHYSIQPGGLVVGEIVYLNTKVKAPILLVGDNRVDSTYRLVEYNKKGEITGVIMAKISGEKMEGSWSNLMDGDLTLALSSHDTVFTVPPIQSDNLSGTYRYDYGLEMPKGEFTYKKVNDSVGVFSIQAKGMGGVPAMVEIKEETVFTGLYGFLYEVPEGKGCGLEVIIFKDFVEVKYAYDSCQELYGENVSPAGVYVKVK